MAQITLFNSTITPTTSGAATEATGAAVDTSAASSLRLTLTVAPSFLGNVPSNILCDAIVETCATSDGPWREVSRIPCRVGDGYTKRVALSGVDTYTRARVAVQGGNLKSALVSLVGEAVGNGNRATTETEYTGTWGSVAASASSASYAASSIVHNVTGLEVGDIVEVEAILYVSASSSSVDTRARLATIDGYGGGSATTTTHAATEVVIDDTPKVQRVLKKIVTVAVAGTFQAVVQLQGNGTASARVHYPSKICARVVRP